MGDGKPMGTIPIGGIAGEAVLRNDSTLPLGCYVGEFDHVGFLYTMEAQFETRNGERVLIVRARNSVPPGRRAKP